MVAVGGGGGGLGVARTAVYAGDMERVEEGGGGYCPSGGLVLRLD